MNCLNCGSDLIEGKVICPVCGKVNREQLNAYRKVAFENHPVVLDEDAGKKPKKHRKNKGIVFLIVVILLALLIIAGLGVLYYKNQKELDSCTDRFIAGNTFNVRVMGVGDHDLRLKEYSDKITDIFLPIHSLKTENVEEGKEGSFAVNDGIYIMEVVVKNKVKSSYRIDVSSFCDNNYIEINGDSIKQKVTDNNEIINIKKATTTKKNSSKKKKKKTSTTKEKTTSSSGTTETTYEVITQISDEELTTVDN